MDGFFGVGGCGRGSSSSDTRRAWGRWTVELAAGIIEILAFFLCSASRGDCDDPQEEIPLEIAFFVREIYARLDVEASAARALADVLSPLGIIRYASIPLFFASYSPWNWLVTNCESLKALISPAPTLRASRRPAIKDSYSASLFDAPNPRRNDCSIISSVGDSSCIPIPDPCLDEAPSTCNFHVWEFDLVPFSFGTSSITKSASTCAFELVRGLYSISYSLSSIAHFASFPDWLGLWSTVHRCCDVMTVIECDSK
ncbi:hypothetical protein YC2023_081657 [Brassica napus]